MSSKRYTYKVLESSDLSEFEQQLTTLGGEGWSAVGYGVLPGGSRSALLQRKQHDGHHHDHDDLHDHQHGDHDHKHGHHHE